MPINLTGALDDVVRQTTIVKGAAELQNGKFNQLMNDYQNNTDLQKKFKQDQEKLTEDYNKNLAKFKEQKEALKASFLDTTKGMTSDDENYIAAKKDYNKQRTGINRQIKSATETYNTKNSQLADMIEAGEVANAHVVKRINAMTRFNKERKEYFKYVKGGNK